MVVLDRLFLSKLNYGEESEALKRFEGSNNEELYKFLSLKQPTTGQPVIHKVIQWSLKNLLKILRRLGNGERLTLLKQRDINNDTPLHLIRHRWDSVKEIIAGFSEETAIDLLSMTNRNGEPIKPRHVKFSLPKPGRYTEGQVKLTKPPASSEEPHSDTSRSEQYTTVNIQPTNGNEPGTPQNVVTHTQPLNMTCSIPGLPDSMKMSLRALAQKTKDGNILLHEICKDPACAPYFESALHLGQDLIPLLHKCNNYGETPLHLSAMNNCSTTLDYCLQHDWAVELVRNVRNKRNETLLHAAISRNRSAAVSTLLLTIVGEPEYLIDERDARGFSCLTTAVRHNNFELFEQINKLLKTSTLSDESLMTELKTVTQSNTTMLHELCKQPDVYTNFFKTCLQLGERLIPLLQKYNHEGETPFHLAVSNNCRAILDLCLQYEWAVRQLLCMRNARKETLLHAAIRLNKVDIVEILLLKTVGKPQYLFEELEENGHSCLTIALKYHRSTIFHMMGSLKEANLLDTPLMKEYTESEVFQNLRSDLSSEELQVFNGYTGTYNLPHRNNKRCRMVAIVAVNHFRGTEHARDGSDQEAVNMVEGWKGVGFKVERIDDWTGETLNKFVIEKITENEGEIACWVLCLLSHGTFGRVTGADGKRYSVSQIIAQAEKLLDGYFPKLTIIQACQKRSAESSTSVHTSTHCSYDADVHHQLPSNPHDEELRTKAHSGILISAGYEQYACRNLFIRLLADQLKACDGRLTLDEIHHRVAKEMCNLEESPPVFKHQLLGGIRFKAH